MCGGGDARLVPEGGRHARAVRVRVAVQVRFLGITQGSGGCSARANVRVSGQARFAGVFAGVGRVDWVRSPACLAGALLPDPFSART